MDLIQHLPIWLYGMIIVGGFVLASVGGLLLYHRLTRNRLDLPEDMNNDVIFFASAIGVFYSLTVGLIAVGVWSNYAEVQNTVSAEAASSAALYRDVSGYPTPLRSELQQALQAYTLFVINEEWPAQYQGTILDGGTRLLDDFQTRLFDFEPETAGQEAIHIEALREYNELVVFRRERVDAVNGGLPGVMWNIVLFGAFLTITVTYLLQIRPDVHMVLTAFLAAFIGLVVFTMAGLDKPLSGPLAISPESYQVVLDRLIELR
jgi:hypothetical protein